MLRVSICDDDVATLSQLEELVRQYLDPGELCLATYSGYGEFLTTRQYVDLLFMDIDLGDGCGIELAKEVKKDGLRHLCDFCHRPPGICGGVLRGRAGLLSSQTHPAGFLSSGHGPGHGASGSRAPGKPAYRHLSEPGQRRSLAGHFLHRIQRPQRHHPRRHPGFANLREALQPPAAGGQPFYSVSQKLSRQHGLRHWLPGQHPGAVRRVWKFL